MKHSVFVLTAVTLTLFLRCHAGIDCSSNMNNKRNINSFSDKCLAKGFPTNIAGCVANGSNDLSKRQMKTCNSLHQRMQTCELNCLKAVDGGFSAFGEWSECSADCEEGQQTRERSCNNPAPSNGGDDCVGESKEVKSCNSGPCSETSAWSRNAGKYLGGYSAGTAKYDNLLKAQSECLERSDCGGITYETSSKKFTLRSGTDLKDSTSGEISWIVSASYTKTSAWSRNAGKYLGGYSAGTAKYDNLLKAQSECLERSDCGGITYETSSKKFTLRSGTDLKDSTSGEISWMAISSK